MSDEKNCETASDVISTTPKQDTLTANIDPKVTEKVPVAKNMTPTVGPSPGPINQAPEPNNCADVTEANTSAIPADKNCLESPVAVEDKKQNDETFLREESACNEVTSAPDENNAAHMNTAATEDASTTATLDEATGSPQKKARIQSSSSLVPRSTRPTRSTKKPK